MFPLRHGAALLLSLTPFPVTAQTPRPGKSLPAPAVTTLETPDLDMYSRIRDEGFNHSHVMDYAGVLFDDIGPRLTGSPAMARANAWTRDQLKAMGCSNAHLESWGDFGMAWTQQSASLVLVQPSASIFLAQATPWSPATPGPVTAEVIMVHGINRGRGTGFTSGQAQRQGHPLRRSSRKS